MLYGKIQKSIYKYRCKESTNLIFGQSNRNADPHVSIWIPVSAQHGRRLYPYDPRPVDTKNLIPCRQIEYSRKDACCAVVENRDENAIFMQGLC